MFVLFTETLLQVNAGKAAGCRGHRMTEREEDEELLSDHNSDEVIVISFDESPAYIKVSQQRNIIYSTEQIF